jgi:hypothetical protein
VEAVLNISRLALVVLVLSLLGIAGTKWKKIDQPDLGIY